MSTLGLVERAPLPGDPCPGFVAEPDRCWRMVYSRQRRDAVVDGPLVHAEGRPLVQGVGVSGSPGRVDRTKGVRPAPVSREPQKTNSEAIPQSESYHCGT